MIPDAVLQQFIDGQKPLRARELRVLVRELLVRRAEVDALRVELGRLTERLGPLPTTPPTPTTPGGVPYADPEKFQGP